MVLHIEINNRISELMDVLEETEGKAIIWATGKEIYKIYKEVEKEYGPGSVVDYYGLTPQDERQDNIRKFQNDPKCRFLIGTPLLVVMVSHLQLQTP